MQNINKKPNEEEFSFVCVQIFFVKLFLVSLKSFLIFECSLLKEADAKMKEKVILVITGVLIAGLAVTVIWCLNSQFASKKFLREFVHKSDEIQNNTEKFFKSDKKEKETSNVTKNNSKSLKCGERSGFVGNVWGGRPSTVNSWPWIVAFQYLTAKRNKFFCAGSLVSDKHIVSGVISFGYFNFFHSQNQKFHFFLKKIIIIQLIVCLLKTFFSCTLFPRKV